MTNANNMLLIMTKNRMSSHLRCFPDYHGYLAGVLGESTLATQAEMNIYIYIYTCHIRLCFIQKLVEIPISLCPPYPM